jgi:hypothetical protein
MYNVSVDSSGFFSLRATLYRPAVPTPNPARKSRRPPAGVPFLAAATSFQASLIHCHTLPSPPARPPPPLLSTSPLLAASGAAGLPNGHQGHSLSGGQIHQEVVGRSGVRSCELPAWGAAAWPSRGVLPRRLC